MSDWKRPAGRPHTSWLATMKNDLSYHNLSVEDSAELTLHRPLWKLLVASGATALKRCKLNDDDDDDDDNQDDDDDE